MRNKKLVLLLTTALMAGSLTTGTLLMASAGTVESKPAGDGLLTATNEINSTNFKVLEQNDGDANAYVPQKVTDYTVNYNGGEWQEMLVGTPVPKETMAKTDVKVILQYKFTGLTADGTQLKIVPGAGALTETHTYGYVLTGNVNGIEVVGSERTGAKDTDPKSKLIAHHAGDAQFDIPQPWQALAWSCGRFKDYIAAHKEADFRLTMTVNANNWVDVKMESGLASANEWAGSTVTNWAPYDGTKDFYTNVFTRYADGLKVDGASLKVSYKEGETPKEETIFETNMDDENKVITKADAEAKAGAFIARGLAYEPNGASGLVITNPAADTGIITRAALQTDKELPVNLELNAQMMLQKLAAGQKVGFAFGYKDSELVGEHKYLYFTVKENKVMFGGEAVAADGTATALFEEVEVKDGVIGDKAIPVKLTGKKANLEVEIGTNDKIVLDDFDADGFFAIHHKGTGELTYMLKDNLTMTGYQFKENEEGAEAITSNFTGGYINSDKFQMASNIAPESHMIKTENTKHDLTGITAEDGKVGFYGTSTNTRILTTKKYADFVLQFDYISVPVQQRGALVLGGNRPSALHIVFGMKEGGLPMTDSTVYTIGMYEGLATEFYGDNETVVGGIAAATKLAPTKGLSKYKETTTPSALSIPRYAGAIGYDASKPNNNVEKWFDADPTAAGTVYSMYNKTTRVKLVCVDNQVALYLAEVDTTTGAIKGEYIEIYNFKAPDAEGYVGIATDSPAYFEIDNFAITPVSRADALAFGESGEALTANFVADIAPDKMANDPMPTPLTKPVLTADTTAKKVTWTKVEGAKDYTVTVKNGTETVLEKTVTATEIDLSSLKKEGTYKVTVEANPENTAEHFSAKGNVDYTIAGDKPVTPPSSDSNSSEKPITSETSSESGCGSIIGAGIPVAVLAGTVLFALKRRKQD